MEMCLLCLELRHESIDCIYVASQQWKDGNIAQIIELHFWPIVSFEKRKSALFQHTERTIL